MGSGSSKKKEDKNRVQTKINATNAFLSATKTDDNNKPNSNRTVSSVSHHSEKDKNSANSEETGENGPKMSEGRRRTRADIFAFIDASRKDKLLVDATDGVAEDKGEEESEVYKIPQEVSL